MPKFLLHYTRDALIHGHAIIEAPSLEEARKIGDASEGKHGVDLPEEVVWREHDPALLDNADFVQALSMPTESPEQTGKFECLACGNTTRFIGTDKYGYGGPDVCEKDCHEQWGICHCHTELVQHFTVWANGELEYEMFTGGGDDAEIGQYTKIVCAVCDTLIWEEE